MRTEVRALGPPGLAKRGAAGLADLQDEAADRNFSGRFGVHRRRFAGRACIELHLT
jgi:hypothetical protein